ncbi:MAG TPA: GNAT family N-acetyltransferase [Acidimicrobiales bacterium]|nr:GNAT family N-acetyltransferase [Acidimicrobiales bacterium]
MATVELLPVAWSDEQVADLNAFENALSADLDPEIPARPAGVTRAHRDLREDPWHVFVARDATGAVIGSAWCDVPRAHDTNVVFTLIGVRADARRRGVGRSLLRAVVDLAQRNDRTTLILGCDHLNAAAEAFAASLGATLAFTGHVNRLTIADVDVAEMQRWVAASHPDYALEWVPDGPYPEDWLADMAHLRGVLVNDAPMGDLPSEARTISFDELRADNERGVAYGNDRWTVIARHVASGEAVGYTEVFMSARDPVHVFQGATAVDAQHRGHGLGRQLKGAMFLRVRAELPNAEYIRTFNADSNEPMLVVNRAMGFVPYIAGVRWTVDVKDLA